MPLRPYSLLGWRLSSPRILGCQECLPSRRPPAISCGSKPTPKPMPESQRQRQRQRQVVQYRCQCHLQPNPSPCQAQARRLAHIPFPPEANPPKVKSLRQRLQCKLRHDDRGGGSWNINTSAKESSRRGTSCRNEERDPLCMERDPFHFAFAQDSAAAQWSHRTALYSPARPLARGRPFVNCFGLTNDSCSSGSPGDLGMPSFPE